ncbi:MAG: PorT family protein [Haliscomenobacteraceae bacterium CHB4]|nr:hypothetical protein [Saprospiraceae bacterium]MCE7924905.1 PorT family protein [Haliscomenobacteraceae bacterium CHB4]
MKLKYTLIFLLTAFVFSLNAQIRYGFKTGLNFANISGPSETDANGKELESWGNVTGFHIGATFGYNFTDNYGLRAEFLYSKRGAKYTFDGESYRVFRYTGGQTLSTGISRYLININNSHLDIPLTFVARWGSFELTAGGYAGFLISSVGDGSLRYSGETVPLGNTVTNSETGATELVFNLNHNYRKDDPGAGEGADMVIAKVDSRNVEIPKTLGAYFDYTEDKGKLYNTLDYGLIGGLAYYLSNSLYVSARLQYGLADITSNKADLSRTEINVSDGTFIYRDDKDKNFVIQASVGFSF